MLFPTKREGGNILGSCSLCVAQYGGLYNLENAVAMVETSHLLLFVTHWTRVLLFISLKKSVREYELFGFKTASTFSISFSEIIAPPVTPVWVKI